MSRFLEINEKLDKLTILYSSSLSIGTTTPVPQVTARYEVTHI